MKKKANVLLTEQEIKPFILDIIKALIYLNQNQIVHRDLKEENILISEDYTAKLADFGLAKSIDN